MKKTIFIIAIILIVSVSAFFLFNKQEDENLECQTDTDCVPASCCHPTSCAPISDQPDCSDMFCTENCAPGTLDCGQGSCGCISNKCEAVFNG